MAVPSSDQQIAFLANLQRLLGEGSFVSTYKYCLLMALADVAVERGADDNSELVVTTSQLAEKFIQYYWRQSTPYLSDQNAGPVSQPRKVRQHTCFPLTVCPVSRTKGVAGIDCGDFYQLASFRKAKDFVGAVCHNFKKYTFPIWFVQFDYAVTQRRPWSQYQTSLPISQKAHVPDTTPEL